MSNMKYIMTPSDIQWCAYDMSHLLPIALQKNSCSTNKKIAKAYVKKYPQSELSLNSHNQFNITKFI